MKYLLLVFLAINPINYVSEINDTQKTARKAFLKKDYKQAVQLYKYLLEELSLEDDKVRFNLAQSYFKNKNYKEAQKYYTKLQMTENKALQSRVLLQLGIIAYKKSQYENALSFFKQSLLVNQDNEKARFNYELLKKNSVKNNKTEKTNQNPKNKDENNEPQKQLKADENGDSKTEANPKQEREVEGNQDLLKPEKLEDLKLNREKVENILEALKNREIQYIQQLKRNRKPQKYAPSKPDW